MGRKPTSGYCLTCRARRVKCDKGQPSCQRCLRSGHTCRGYGPDQTLRMRNFGVSMTGNTSPRLMQLMNPRPYVELDLSGFRENIAFTYFFEKYPWALFWRPLVQVEHNDQSPLQYKGSLALVYGYYGSKNHDKSSEIRGMELYGHLIGQVKLLLARGSKDELSKATIAVMVLGMFTYAVDKNLALQTHLGIAQILQYCGPRLFGQEPLLSAFRSCRRVLICQAFAQRQRTFLERPEWKTQPFDTVPKEPADELFDILADMPGVAEDLADFQGSEMESIRQELTQKVDILYARLISWRSDWQSLNDGAVRRKSREAPAPQGSRRNRVKSLLYDVLEFDSMAQATEIFAYNATLLYLIQLKNALQSNSLGTGPLSSEDMDFVLQASTDRADGSELLAPFEVKFPCQAAIEAFRMLPYLHRHWKDAGEKDISIIAPLGVTFCVLEQQPELREHIAWDKLLPTFNTSVREELEAYKPLIRLAEER